MLPSITFVLSICQGTKHYLTIYLLRYQAQQQQLANSAQVAANYGNQVDYGNNGNQGSTNQQANYGVSQVQVKFWFLHKTVF